MTTKEEVIWRAQVKANAILSDAVRKITEEQSDRFFSAEHFTGKFTNVDEITLIGDFDIFSNAEIHKLEIEYEGEKRTYKIILKRG